MEQVKRKIFRIVEREPDSNEYKSVLKSDAL